MNTSVHSIALVAFNKAIAEELNVRLRNPRALPPKTEYSKNICREVEKRQGHVVVAALAGSGKTTLLEQIVASYPGADTRATTLHGLGFNAYRYHMRSQKGVNDIDVKKDKISIIMRQILKYEQLNIEQQQKAEITMSPAARLCDLARTHLYTSVLPEPTNEDLIKLCDHYNIELPEYEESGVNETEVFDLVRASLKASNATLTTIDFVDMIHLPLHLNVRFYQNDLMLIDESQDLDPSQIEMIRRAVGTKGQAVFSGDDNQAIYGFRGADTEAIASMISIFNAKKLPLSTCWRCPINVIKEAQQIVPEIEWAPNAIEGLVSTLDSHDDMLKLAEAGNFVLCRTTAPLVDACMKFIRNGKAATVRGRDIGQGLQLLTDKIKRRRTSKGKELVAALQAYAEDALAKLSHPSKESQRQSLSDKIDTLLVLSEECTTFDTLKRKIESIFSDSEGGHLILCSTAHKAKGLESERVFIIHPELMPHPCARQDWQRKQERNLKYVAITRATRELYWVLDGKPKKASNVPVEASEEKTVEVPTKKTRKIRSDKGKPRKSKQTVTV